jgi:hypothetical protein
MTAFNSAIHPNAYDVIPTKATLVDTSRGDPDVSICVPNGKIPTGRGRHPIVIDAIHYQYEFISGMEKVCSRIHLYLKASLLRFVKANVYDTQTIMDFICGSSGSEFHISEST